MRLLDTHSVPYREIVYDIDDGEIDGMSVCRKVGAEPAMFFKTLVAKSREKKIYVLVIPVLEHLDLKKAAKVIGEKHIDMVEVKELLGLTGYIRGGCSPIGMKKAYPTYYQQSLLNHEEIVVSGGRQGLLIGLAPADLLLMTQGKTADLIVR